MKVPTLERHLNIYLLRGYPEFWSQSQKGAKQLRAQLKNGVACKKSKLKCICKSKIYLTKNVLMAHKKVINWHKISAWIWLKLFLISQEIS